MNDEPTSDMKNLHHDAKGNLQKGNKSRIEEIKERAKKNSEIFKGVYTNSHLIERLEHINKMIDGPVFVVAHDGKVEDAYKSTWANGEKWTISADPNAEGWETDSGCSGYGLYPEVAEYYAMCINEYQSLLSNLEIAEKALEQAFEAEGYSFLEEALQQIRE